MENNVEGSINYKKIIGCVKMIKKIKKKEQK